MKLIFRNISLMIIFFLFSIYKTQCNIPKKILVTGGAGFIGSHVAESLLKRGDYVIVVDDINDYYDTKIKESNLNLLMRCSEGSEKFVFYKTDICDEKEIDSIFAKEQPEIVCHLAARAGVRASIMNPDLYCKANILGTLNLLEMARRYSVKNFVFASSSSIYGESSTPPFHESERADCPLSPYAATKRAGELMAYAYHELYGIPCTILRFFTVYGPRGRPDMAPFKFVDAIYHGQPIVQYGNGTAIRDFTYIDDIVSGVVASIDTVYDFEIFNLGKGEPIILKEFIKVIEEVIGKPVRINQKEPIGGDVQCTHADISRAVEYLGYQPKTSIREGITNFYHWYQSEYLPMEINK